MKRLFSVVVSASVFSLLACAQITLDSCLSAAREHYPAVRKLAIIEKTSDIELADINKAWLPRIALVAQGTVQNAVPTFPEALSGMMDKLGTQMEGLSKWQYRAGVELSQTIWDGGASRARRNVQSASADVQKASVEVELYALRERVENAFFATLLLDQQTRQIISTKEMLESKLAQVKTFVSNGVALNSDADMLEAQILGLEQQLIQARNARQGYISMLHLLTNIDFDGKDLRMPQTTFENAEGERPEMALFDARLGANKAASSLRQVALMPKFALFGQSFYGNPGLDNFASMMDRKGSFNAIGGIKAVWNIDAFYTDSDLRRKNILEREAIESERETFVLNQKVQSQVQNKTIKGLQDLQESDERILQLRTNIRKSADAQFNNGVIDIADLLNKINDETLASLNAQYHKIQLIREIYRLKYLTNK